MKNLILLMMFSFISVKAGADSCVLIALNASQRQVFSQYGQVQGFQAGCLVVQQDNNTLYEWNGVNYTAIASTSAIVVPSGTAGGIPYYSAASTLSALGAGTSGYCLKSGGTSAPTWAACATPVVSGNLTDAGTDGITVTGGTNAVLGSGTSLAQHVSDATHNGYVSSTDWNTFNNKQSTLTLGNLTDAGTDGITVTGGNGSVIGSGTSLAQHVADMTHNGYLLSTDWNTFNGKENVLSFGAPLSRSTNTISIPVATSLVDGYLSSSDWSIFNGKQASGNYITALTSDVSASGPGSAAATVNSVGGSSASDVHTAELAANAATNANTVSTIVKRDSSGNFVAGTITAVLTGTASGNTTYTANQYGVVLSGSGNTMTVLAPDSSTTKVLTSGGTGANPSWAATGNLTEATSSVLTITGGTNAVVGSGATIQVKAGSGSQNGYISSTDWSTFNNKLSTSSSGWTHSKLHFGPKSSGCSATVMPTTGCSSNPCDICQQTPNFVTAVNWSSTGVYVVHFATAYSAAPMCSIQLTNYSGSATAVTVCLLSAATTSTVTFSCLNNGGASNNVSAQVECDGAI